MSLLKLKTFFGGHSVGTSSAKEGWSPDEALRWRLSRTLNPKDPFLETTLLDLLLRRLSLNPKHPFLKFSHTVSSWHQHPVTAFFEIDPEHDVFTEYLPRSNCHLLGEPPEARERSMQPQAVPQFLVSRTEQRICHKILR